MEGRQEVDVSRGEGKVELAIHLLLDPKVSLHVAFVHSFVNPLLFVVLHKGCRWVKYMTKCLKPFKVDILLQLTRRATLDLLCCNFSQYSAREVAVTSNTEEERWCAHNVRRSQVKEFKVTTSAQYNIFPEICWEKTFDCNYLVSSQFPHSETGSELDYELEKGLNSTMPSNKGPEHARGQM